jgi:uncharacterized membrane protein YhiD involved in acid resistance
LAAGVGLWMLALFATVFILGVLWLIESFEPKAREPFLLKVKTKDPAAAKARIEELLARNRLPFQLRTSLEEEVCYEVQLPLDRKTERLSEAILKLDPGKLTGVEWEREKSKG